MNGLVDQINALLALKNAVPHPVPGLARELLQNSAARIEELEEANAKLRGAWKAAFIDKVMMLRQVGGKMVIEKGTLQGSPFGYEIIGRRNDSDETYVIELVQSDRPSDLLSTLNGADQ